jgi:hypothetical protein
MIRYSSYGSSNNRTPIAHFFHRDPLAVEYGELLELRERVRKAEAEVEILKRPAIAERRLPQCR